MKKIILFTALALSLSVASVKAEEEKNPIVRAQFTSEVKDREPVDRIVTVDAENVDRIVFFNEIKDFKNGKINHTWMNADKQVYSKDFNISSDRFRFSTNVKSSHFKKWDTATVIVKDAASGEELGRFLIQIH